ncbi:hypothetical protein Syn7502_02820 [Synechococcus sp. PCC 7502]|uniref:hypothetical protein n=1 Tax=Synechococcus sp. PCC 7502 TaxID=1173263 RepID=UPI00029FDC56|nr:hypothetical protein [Synechococcus sp. PCC 7502]AFY74757.1 hypothetical protein Syn7502_02820 [Synechococcus sp. PCC 7502]
MKREKTTTALEPELKRSVLIRAAIEGREFCEVLNDAIRRGLNDKSIYPIGKASDQ